MRCNVSLPKHYGRNPATFVGLPPITKEKPVELDLDEPVIDSLRAKGVRVELLKAEPEPEPGPEPEAKTETRRSTRPRRKRGTKAKEQAEAEAPEAPGTEDKEE